MQAANPLAVNLAMAEGISISWALWATAAIVPGLILLATVPLILYIVYPPEVKDTPDAPAKAREELKKLGPLSLNEKITAGEPLKPLLPPCNASSNALGWGFWAGSCHPCYC